MLLYRSVLLGENVEGGVARQDAVGVDKLRFTYCDCL